MRNKKVGHIKVKITDKRMYTKLWGIWSVRRTAICIAMLAKRMANALAKHMAKELECTPEYILQLATEVLSKDRQSWDCDENGGEDE